jgi:hypothetical protein
VSQHTGDEELHIAIRRVQADMRVGGRARAVGTKRFWMQCRAEIVQGGDLRNDLARLDERVDGE